MSDDHEGARADGDYDLDALAWPGLHELVVDDPAAEAPRLAELLGGEAIVDRDLLETIEARERAREAVTVPSGPADGSPVRVLADIDGIRALARSLARAERIHTSTTQNMMEAVGQRVTGGSIAVHPDSIRRAADDLLAARREVATIEAELARARGDEDDERDVDEDAETDDSSDDADATVGPAEAGGGWGRLPPATKRRIVGVVVMAIGFAQMVGALLLATVGLAAVIVLVVPIAAIWWAIDTTRIDLADVEDKQTASSNLASISARTDELFRSAATTDGSSTIPASSAGQTRLIEGRLDLARERLRSAEFAWSDLAGANADPTDIDRVLRDRDPQYYAAMAMVEKTSQSRASAAHLRRVNARWKVIWSALDREPPGPAAAEAAARDLEAEGIRAVRVAGRGDAAMHDASPSERAAPLVLADLSDDVEDSVVERLAVLADTTSIVVLRSPGDG